MTDPTPSQRLAEAVEILRAHNAWRRGDESAPATDPGKLGAAIDTVCELVPEMIAEDMITIPRDLLESLIIDTPCEMDHHGGCQEHGYLSLEMEECPQAEAKRLLRGARSGGGD